MLVCAAVVFVERSLKIDDSRGRHLVHGVCGLWGISVGRPCSPNGTYGCPGGNGVGRGGARVFYGDASQLLAPGWWAAWTNFVPSARWRLRVQGHRLVVGGHPRLG